MAKYVTKILTVDGPTEIDYNALANKPTSMTPKTHADTHKIGGSDPLWTATTSKAGLMSSNDKKKLDTVDLEKIDAINVLTQYLWKRRKFTEKITRGDLETVSLLISILTVNIVPDGMIGPDGQPLTPGKYERVENQKVQIAYADQVSLNRDTNAISLVSATTTDILSSVTMLDVVKGKYWYSTQDGASIIYYTPADAANATASTSEGVNGSSSTRYSISAQQVTGTFTWSNWEWVSSDSESAYPSSGEKSGYEYISYGGLDNRKTSAVFDVGYYVGTGTVGSSGKNSITFPFVPKYVVISQKLGSTGLTCTFTNPLTTYYANSSINATTNARWNGKTLSWWLSGGTSSSASSTNQLNASGTRYYYAAWG